ncbi:hypothetical protein ACVRW4_00180 [Streptococcus phocae subsp. phocae]
MKNIVKKSLPLLVALTTTATALPLSLATTTTVSASEYWEKPEQFKNQYFVNHWIEITAAEANTKSTTVEAWNQKTKHNGRYFKLADSVAKRGELGEKTNEAPKDSLKNEKAEVEIENIYVLGDLFNDEVNIYYYNNNAKITFK